MTRRSDVDPSAGSPFDPWPDAHVHVEWGRIGARLAAERGDAVVIVDVLSLTTTLTMAAEAGIDAYVRSAEELDEHGGAPAVAEELGATLAVGKRRAEPGQISLSPATFVRPPLIRSALFSSLNGAAAIAAAAASPLVAAACLRNRSAAARLVARWLADHDGARVTVVASGEHWSSVAPVDGFRPAVEDLLGAGAVVEALLRGDGGLVASTEARAAAALYGAVGVAGFADLVGARELRDAGFADDVTLAADVDVTTVVPVLDRDAGRFVATPA